MRKGGDENGHNKILSGRKPRRQQGLVALPPPLKGSTWLLPLGDAQRRHPLRKCDSVMALDLFEALQSFHTNHMLAVIKSGAQDWKLGSAVGYLYDLGQVTSLSEPQFPHL